MSVNWPPLWKYDESVNSTLRSCGTLKAPSTFGASQLSEPPNGGPRTVGSAVTLSPNGGLPAVGTSEASGIWH